VCAEGGSKAQKIIGVKLWRILAEAGLLSKSKRKTAHIHRAETSRPGANEQINYGDLFAQHD
jgi:hypothetical protein